MVIGQDGGDSRLLQHYFRDPDAVGIAAGAPGEVALMRAEPGEKAALKGLQRAGSKLRCHAGGIVAQMRLGSAAKRSRWQEYVLREWAVQRSALRAVVYESGLKVRATRKSAHLWPLRSHRPRRCGAKHVGRAQRAAPRQNHLAPRIRAGPGMLCAYENRHDRRFRSTGDARPSTVARRKRSTPLQSR